VSNIVEIDTMQYFWSKTEFSICIEDTSETIAKNPSGNISAVEYRTAVENGIKRWETVLQKFSKANSDSQHLGTIQFDIKENCNGNEDIVIEWRDTNRSNGQTFFCIDNGVVVRSKFFITKQKPDGIIHSIKQIESITAHELGHVLGLGHMVGYSTKPFTNDLMISNTPIQPDPKRKISNIDLLVLSAIFDTYSRTDRSRIYPRYVFPFNFWKSEG